MTEMKTYRATAVRDGAWWVIRVPAINSATQARRLDQAEAMVRDLVHAITDQPLDSFDVEVHPDLPGELPELLVRTAAASGRARVAQLEASIATREAAVALDKVGLTVRDIGSLLGVSYQRVQQLLADRTEPAVLRDRLEREMTPVGDSGTIVFQRQPVEV